MQKKWLFLDTPSEQIVNELANSLSIPEKNAFLLAQRGITSFDEGKYFFRPQLNDLHDPFLMKGMKKAIERIEKAIENQENILIYGDYDVDGTTAVSIVYSFFSSFYKNIHYYIPDRYKEGYGVSMQGIDFASDNNFSLIICLDCGIRAVKTIAYANEKKIDFIVCDHHLPGDKLPKAVAILDPKQKKCNYPFKELSGAGVGFKLIQAYSQKKGIGESEYLKYLDLVCVSIAADIVSITGENRILAYYGLKKLNTKPVLGLKILLELEKKQQNDLTVSDVVFKIAPKINAAGRIKSGMAAVELLIEKNSKEAQETAKAINGHNINRKEFDANITQEALQIIEEEKSSHKKTTVVFQPHWHKGVVGIVASRLTETYYRPTIVLTESNGFLTGSARSVFGYNIYEAIESCSHLLDQFGGHKFAAGLSLIPENLELFKNQFEEFVANNILPEQLIPTVSIDLELELEDITQKFFNIVKQMAPFGPDNPSPTFVTKNLIALNSRLLTGNHLKLEIANADFPKAKFDCIGFGLGDFNEPLSQNKRFSICYHIEENNWNGNTNLQLVIKDLKLE